VIE
jgi:hypothetical protein